MGVSVQRLDDFNTPVAADNPRGGINVYFDLHTSEPLQQSPVWVTGGRRLQLFRLGANETLTLGGGRHFVKVVIGRIANLERSCLAAPFAVRATGIDVDELVAGEDGALFMLMSLAEDAAEMITDMASLTFEGPLSHALVWQRFDAKFAGITDYFDGKDCYMASGIHVLDEHDDEIVYVNPWTCGKGVDLSTHNHAHAPSPMAPAFAEVHWVLAAATEQSGMYRTPEPGADERERFVMGLGDEHGPFYDRDASGLPVLRENGAVQYPWHGWQGGDDGSADSAYDFVAAFEINPSYMEARL